MCVNVNTASTKASAGFSSFKNLISPSINRQISASFGYSGQPSATGITYRIISHIPKTFGEIESRKSLALKAASSVVTSNPASVFAPGGQEQQQISVDTDHSKPQYNISHFEFYAKTIQAVDSILQRDRDQQRLAIKKELGGKAGSEALELANLRTSRSSLNVYKSSSRLTDTVKCGFKSASAFQPNLTPYEDDESDARIPYLPGKNRLSKCGHCFPNLTSP